MIEILQPGILTTIQDSGRAGFEAYGVPHSGFFDPFLAAIANKLAGNPLDSPVLEFALTGPTLLFLDPCCIALSGYGLRFEINSKPVREFSSVLVAAGSTLKFFSMHGWFGYLAVSGGFRVEPVLGSASTYIAGKIGGRLEKGGRLDTGKCQLTGLCLRKEFHPAVSDAVLLLLPGMHTRLFSESEKQKIVQGVYRIGLQSNRMGIRMEGAGVEPPEVKRSAPALSGTIQIPGSGQPILLGPEGPTTGGYAQLGVMSRTSWSVLAGVRPGKEVRFEWTVPEQAVQIRHDRDRLLETPEAWEFA